MAWTPPQLRKKYNNMSPLTATTLREWDRFHKEQGFDRELSPVFLLDSFYGLIPSLNMASWSSRGLIYLHQLFDQGEVIPFRQLQNTYHLPNAAAFAHRQIHSWLQKNKKVLPAGDRWGTFTELESLCTQTKRPLKLISTLYNHHHRALDPHTLQFVKAWEAELGRQLTKEQWSHILYENKKLTLSTAHLELARKVLYRWYLVPTRLKHMIPKSTGLCWRCNKAQGTMLHIWWDCLVLTPLWTDTQALIKNTTGVALAHTPEHFLLQYMPPHHTKTSRYLMYHIILAVLLQISKHWQKQTTPSIQSCITHIETIKGYEIMARSNNPPQKLWKKAWEKWDTYQQKTVKP
ncbi:Hypothetical predicted protein [Pelobates cultripes]|uniref:Uncharacterized protein n=1 Tax=Pelobates cultripes TaxID=61616 RepID=A0AAD1WBT1_PELCU|nr:Hypothetical predicted protein [Pelobates cultripes]